MLESKNLTKRYQRISRQIEEYFKKDMDPTARMATCAAVLHHKLPHFFWTGFYRREGNRLVVGPYQGPVACPILPGKYGVCWAGVSEQKTVIVPDVHKFPGHIACDGRSNSEIVVPLFKDGEVWAVLDVDSNQFDAFRQEDGYWLEKIVAMI
jgi:L-methionine (R)-S-oxide reductase